MIEFEEQIYCEIMDAYEECDQSGIFEYRELIKLMKLLNSGTQNLNQATVDMIITNAIILILTLFFKKSADPFLIEQIFSKEEEAMIRRLLIDALNGKAGKKFE